MRDLVPHLAARCLPPSQRHWLGPSCLLQRDRTKVITVGRHVTDATMICHFWHTMATDPTIDQVMFRSKS